jgi:hypothetical protein
MRTERAVQIEIPSLPDIAVSLLGPRYHFLTDLTEMLGVSPITLELTEIHRGPTPFRERTFNCELHGLTSLQGPLKQQLAEAGVTDLEITPANAWRPLIVHVDLLPRLREPVLVGHVTPSAPISLTHDQRF